MKTKIGFCALFLFFLALNLATPLYNDDIRWEILFRDNFAMPLETAKMQFFSWHPRLFEFLYLSLILPLGLKFPFFIDALNAAIACVFSYLFFYFIFMRLPKCYQMRDLAIFILMIAAFFAGLAFSDVFLWLTGSTNYLWSAVFILISLLPFRIYLNNILQQNQIKDFKYLILQQNLESNTNESQFFAKFIAKTPPLFLILFSFLHFISGLLNESFSIFILGFYGLGIIFLMIKKIKIPLFVWLFFACFLAGFALFLYLQFQAQRILNMDIANFFALGFIDKIAFIYSKYDYLFSYTPKIFYIFMLFACFLRFGLNAFIALILAIISSIILSGIQNGLFILCLLLLIGRRDRLVLFCGILFLCAFISFLPYVFIFYQPVRMWSMQTLIFIAIIMMLAMQMKYKFIIGISAFIIICFSFYNFMLMGAYFHNINNIVRQQIDNFNGEMQQKSCYIFHEKKIDIDVFPLEVEIPAARHNIINAFLYIDGNNSFNDFAKEISKNLWECHFRVKSFKISESR